MHEAGALRVGGARGLADGDRLGDEIVGAIEVQRVLPGESEDSKGSAPMLFASLSGGQVCASKGGEGACSEGRSPPKEMCVCVHSLAATAFGRARSLTLPRRSPHVSSSMRS